MTSDKRSSNNCYKRNNSFTAFKEIVFELPPLYYPEIFDRFPLKLNDCLFIYFFSRKRNKNKIDTSADSAPQTTGKPSISFKLRLNDLWENPELLISNMAADRLRKVASSIPEYFLTKFPYVQAWTLVMLVAERALKVEK